MEDPLIHDASPVLGSTDGGTPLHIMAEFNTQAQMYACQVSSISHIVVRWLSPDEIECITPARKFGRAEIFVQTGAILKAWRQHFTYYQHFEGKITHLNDTMSKVKGIDVTDSESGYMIDARVQQKMASFFPSMVGAIGGVVTVSGNGFSEVTCVHHGATMCYFVSGAVIRTEVDAGEPGEYVTPLTLESKPGTRAVRLMYENDAVATIVRPERGSMDGGTMMIITGEGFINSVRLGCEIGTTAPVSGRWIDSHAVECVSQAHVKGIVDVTVTNGYPHLHREGVTFRYEASNAISTYQCDDARGQFEADAHQTSVARDQELAVFEMTQKARVMCRVSFTNVGLVTSTVGSGGYGADVNYEVVTVSEAKVRSIIPMHIESGMHHPVQVVGKDFSADRPFCVVNDEVWGALIVSSAVAICELPDYAGGDVNLAIGRKSGSANSGLVTFFRHVRVIEITPSSGPEAGGTLVVIKTDTERQSPLQCRFGSTGPVAARATSAAAYQCTSPSHIAIPVPVGLSILLFGLDSNAAFSFHSVSPNLDVVTLKSSHVSLCKFSCFLYSPATLLT